MKTAHPKAAPTARNPWGREAERRFLSDGGRGSARARAASWPRRRWKRKAKGGALATEAVQTQGEGGVFATAAAGTQGEAPHFAPCPRKSSSSRSASQ